MTIPATPAKTEKTRIGYEAVGCIGSDVVVIRCRMCGEQHRVSRQRFEAGEYDVPTADASAPHLADEWRRLRKAEDEAADFYLGEGQKATGDDLQDHLEKWIEARCHRKKFEDLHGIGGGA